MKAMLQHDDLNREIAVTITMQGAEWALFIQALRERQDLNFVQTGPRQQAKEAVECLEAALPIDVVRAHKRLWGQGE